MATYEVHVRASRRRVLQFLRVELPAQLAGREPDVWGIARAASMKMIHAALTDIHEDFEKKSLGGAGADGTIWEPLHPHTIRRRSGKRGGKEGRPGKKKMTDADHAWLSQTKKDVYQREFRRLRGSGLSNKEARRQAAIISRFLTKSLWQARSHALGKGTVGEAGEGPEDFPILDDTGRLKESVAPGSLEGAGLATHYVPAGKNSGDQEVVFYEGKVAALSHVPYGDKHMRDGRTSKADGADIEGGFRPARPWKYPDRVPDEWISRWAIVYCDAVAEMLPEILVRLSE